MKYNFRQNPCIRIQLDNIKPGELHPCYFCGVPIDVSNIPDCPVCALKQCSSCGKCFCNINEEEQQTLVKIHQKYCCNYDNLLYFSRIDMTGNRNIIRNANLALTYCHKKFESGNAYPFMQNLASGNIINPYFGHDISEWFRYAVFGLKNIPVDAKRILDIGPGYMDGPMIYQENRPDLEEIYVLDCNVTNLHSTGKIRIVEGDMRDISKYFGPGFLDFVSCFEMIEHLTKEDGIKALIDTRNILKPEGIFVLSTPNRQKERQGIHLREWTFKEILNELEEKFEVLYTYGNRIDLGKLYSEVGVFSSNDYNTINNLIGIVPDAILANIFSISYPANSYIGVYVCKKI